MVTNGGKQAVYETFQLLLNSGDEVIIPPPYWTSYPEPVKLAGGLPVEVFSGAEVSFEPNVANLEAKTYAMPGWRVGWMVAHERVAKAAAKLQGHMTSNVNNIAQRAALAAVSGRSTMTTRSSSPPRTGRATPRRSSSPAASRLKCSPAPK